MFSELQARLSRLKEAHPLLRLHVLVEGLAYQQQQKDLPLEAEPAAIPILRGTSDEALSDAGPWLLDAEFTSIAMRQALERLEQTTPSVSWIIAPYDIDALTSMLRQRLDVCLPDGRTAMLRFWDPRVLATLGRDLNHEQRRIFFGDIVEWHLLLDGRRVHIARHHADPH